MKYRIPNQEAILVLGPDKNDFETINQAAHLKGLDVAEFASVDDAIGFATKNRPIAVFADLALANEGRGRFLQELRTINSQLPVVVMMHEQDSAALLSILHFGVNDLLMRPFISVDVAESLSRVLSDTESGLRAALLAISHRLRDARLRLGLNQRDLARRTGLSTAQISQIEGHVTAPSMTSLLKICKVLRTPVSEIVHGI